MAKNSKYLFFIFFLSYFLCIDCHEDFSLRINADSSIARFVIVCNMLLLGFHFCVPSISVALCIFDVCVCIRYFITVVIVRFSYIFGLECK